MNICGIPNNRSITPEDVRTNACIPFSNITITPSLVRATAWPPFLTIVAGSISGNLKFGILTVGKLSVKKGEASDADIKMLITTAVATNNITL